MQAFPSRDQPGQPALGDPIGQAFLDAQAGRPEPLVVERDDGFIAVDAIGYLDALDERDLWAVGQLAGRVVDVGAGAGRAAHLLQERGQQVTALDTSPGAVRACRQRGIGDVYLGSPRQAAADGMAAGFDSALLLGNNIGLLASREAAGPFLADVGALLRPGGVIVGTASDPYQTGNRAHLDYHERNRERGRLPGHATIRVRYQRLATGWFDWLIPSPGELEELARPVGWQITDLRRGPGPQYAVVLGRIGGLGRLGHPGGRPAADYVTHRQHAHHLLALDHHEVPEAAPDHRCRGVLHGPVPRREHDVLGAVPGGDLNVGAFPGGDRQQQVSLGEDADPGVVRVHDDRGSDLARRHHPRRLTQRVGRPDG